MIYGYLFSASVAMAGFTALFLVFRYQILDTYVDNRKYIIRLLLKREIISNPWLQVKIQNIGKDPREDDIEYFNQLNKSAVNWFVNDILKKRNFRNCVIKFGRLLIFLWGTLSLIYIFQYFVHSCHYITIILFFLLMILTLVYIFWTFLKKRL